MAKHGRDETCGNRHDTHAGGDKMGKREKRVGDPNQVPADELIRRLHTRKGSDLSSMDTGQ